MKALIISDLHSNIQALEAIWKIEKDSDFIFCAGDLVDIGPNPNEVIQWILDHKATCIKGNHDHYLLDAVDKKTDISTLPQEEKTWLSYNASIIKPKNIDFLRSLPETLTFELDKKQYFMKHIYNKYNIIQSKFEFESFMKSQSISQEHHLILGHTHKQTITYFSKNQIMLNPGSTAYRAYLDPKDISKKAEYLTITDGIFELKGIDYDKSQTRQTVNALKDIVEKNSYEKMIIRLTDGAELNA